MAQYYFETRSLSVGYNGTPLIQDISIGIEKGEIVTLIGPNGAGKSTILKSITRQLRPISGQVVMDGQSLHTLTHKQLATRMAVVLTERLKPELMTCRDIVASGRYPYTGRLGILSRKDEEKVTQALETVHALDLSDRDFNTVSDGQRQRVLLARAICQEPEIIVLDEPTSFLDIRHKLELLAILRTMAKEKGITIIMSLHEIDLAQKISDKILCVKGKTVERFGTPQEVFDEEQIRALYDIDQGYFDPCFGSVELARPSGQPEVLVISSSGRGIPVYRALQKRGIPFFAGVLYTNDLDYRLARLLAAEVVAEKPFQELSDASLRRAMELVEGCRLVIDAGCEIGPCNQRITQLFRRAEELGKLRRGFAE